MIFRAHGVTKENYKIAKKKNLEVHDLTCKKVIDVHKKVEEKKDYFEIIIGSKIHPESVATLSFAGDNSTIVEGEEDLDKTAEMIINSGLKKVYIVAQTTYSSKKYDELVENITNRMQKNNIEVISDKTICMATEIRQQEADELSKIADYIVIIGGKNSSNTKKLYEIASKNCSKFQFIEDENELNLEAIDNKINKVLILAGASTPDESIIATKEKIMSK